MSDEQNKPTKTEDEVEGHSVGKPVTKPLAADDDASPDFEGHSMGKPVAKPVTKPVI